MKSSSFLMHYGIPGQKWGVKTKEYEPVAVDHRRSHYRSYNHSQSYNVNSQTNGYNNTYKNISNNKKPVSNNVNANINKSDVILKQKSKSESQIKAQKEKVKKIITAVGAVSLAAIAGFAAYKAGKVLTGRAKNIKELYLNKNKRAAIGRAIAKRNGDWMPAEEIAFKRSNRQRRKAALEYLIKGY